MRNGGARGSGFPAPPPAIHASDCVDPDTGRVDDATGAQGRPTLAQRIPPAHTAQATAFVHQALEATVIHQQRPLHGGRSGQGQRQARVIKLCIPVLHAGAQALGARAGQAFERLAAAQPAGRPQAGGPGQCIVELEPQAIERRLP